MEKIESLTWPVRLHDVSAGSSCAVELVDQGVAHDAEQQQADQAGQPALVVVQAGVAPILAPG